MKPIKISFYGLFGQGNLGNECTLQAILYHARKAYPDGRFNCICSGPEDTSTRHRIPAIPISRRYVRTRNPKAPPRLRYWLVMRMSRAFIRIPMEVFDWIVAFKTLIGTHMLIVPGTGVLTDAYSSTFGWPYDIFKWSLIARLCRCRLVYVSVGAGPIYRPLSRWFIRSALSLADFRSYRDNSTLEYLRSIGFSRISDRVSPDLAFNLPQSVMPRGPFRGGSRRIVGIGLMSYAGKLSTDKPSQGIHVAYLGKLVLFAEWLLGRDYDVRLLIGDVSYDPDVTREFKEKLKQHAPTYDEVRIVDEPASSVEELLSQLAATDVVVATRFHNVLLALLLNKPVISISFHHKCVSLMSGMGLSEYCQDLSELDLTRLIEQFCELERNAETLRALIWERTEEYRRVLDEQYRVIFSDRMTRAEHG